MGLMKSFHTELTSGRQTNRKKVKREAAKAEAWIMEQIKLSFITETEFREWLMDGHERKWEECAGCPLKNSRVNVMHGEGTLTPIWTMIGEGPKEREDLFGLPLQGKDGMVMRKICAKVGLRLDLAWLTDVVACRVKGDKKPAKEHRQRCRPKLEEQLGIVQPYVIVLLGKTAMQDVLVDLDRSATVREFRGLVPKEHWPTASLGRHSTQNLKAVFVTFAPSHVTLQPTVAKKRAAAQRIAQDLKKVKRVVDFLQARRERDN